MGAHNNAGRKDRDRRQHQHLNMYGITACAKSRRRDLGRWRANAGATLKLAAETPAQIIDHFRSLVVKALTLSARNWTAGNNNGSPKTAERKGNTKAEETWRCHVERPPPQASSVYVPMTEKRHQGKRRDELKTAMGRPSLNSLMSRC